MARTRRRKSEPQLSQGFREIELIYGALATVVGVGSILSVIFHPLSSGILADVDGLVWVVFLVVYWLAFRFKKVGKAWLWQVLMPLCVAVDLVYLAISPGQTKYERIVYYLLSLPLYFAAIWYAYKFMPGKVSKPKITHEFLD